MGKVGDRGGIRQAKLDNSDHLCDLHTLPDTNAGVRRSAVEVPVLQKVANTHPIPVNSCEFLFILYIW